MAYLIDKSYFIKELTIPNLNITNMSNFTEDFDQWIDKEARLCLQRALGFTLFNELDSFIDNNGRLLSTAPQKWQNLVNGHTYTYQDEELRWKGLIFTEGTFKGSLLAYYVYAEWLKFQLSHMSGFGEVRGEAVNSIPQNSTHRFVKIWNTFVDMYQENLFGGGFYFYRQQFPAVSHKRHIIFVDYADYQDRTYVSLLEYLTHNEDDFPETDRFVYEYTNTLGI